tara:strand:+ start:518 stop:898 length:381 start_codon:yes stop_codon:yes gene_type:complete
MKKAINITQKQLRRLVEDSVEDTYIDNYDVEDEIGIDSEDDDEGFDIESILSPEEITGLLEEQIVQLQDRTEYLEQLQADMMEFTEALMGDLNKHTDLNLRRSTQKLRALETRAGREIFWLKSRRL